MDIKIEKPSTSELQRLGVLSWPIWEKEKSAFDWHYDQTETCYFLEGSVEIELLNGRKVKIGRGELVVFPQGLQCRWHIHERVRKHYSFE